MKAKLKRVIDSEDKGEPPPPPPYVPKGLIAAAGILGFLLVCQVAWKVTHPTPGPEGVLRWGGDTSGGAPFAWEERGKLKGFEVELLQHVADRLKMRAQFVQVPWDMQFKALERGDIDLVFNGWDWSPQRALEMNATIPYGLGQVRLIVRKGERGPGAIRDWDDLRRPGPNG
jgi:ABC-type amino acid transport substrate-binding protein